MDTDYPFKAAKITNTRKRAIKFLAVVALASIFSAVFGCGDDSYYSYGGAGSSSGPTIVSCCNCLGRYDCLPGSNQTKCKLDLAAHEQSPVDGECLRENCEDVCFQFRVFPDEISDGDNPG